MSEREEMRETIGDYMISRYRGDPQYWIAHHDGTNRLGFDEYTVITTVDSLNIAREVVAREQAAVTEVQR